MDRETGIGRWVRDREREMGRETGEREMDRIF